jgi:electron transport complex protein RnfC
VDAIVGAPQLMHTVLADRCTGCELCVAPCPVDCISLEPAPAAAEARPIRLLARPRNREPAAPELPCIRCAACERACPESLLPQELLWYSRGADWDTAAARGLDACIECGLCNQVCPSNIDLLTHFSRGRQVLSSRARARAAAELARSRYAQHQTRVQAREGEREERRRLRLDAAGQRPWQR